MREWTLKRGLDVTCPKCKGTIMGNRDEHGIVVVNPRQQRPRYYHKYCYITKLMRGYEDYLWREYRKYDCYSVGYADSIPSKAEKMAEEYFQWELEQGYVIVESWSEYDTDVRAQKAYARHICEG